MVLFRLDMKFVEKLKNPFRFLRSWFWVLYYGYPAKKLTVIAVTGTDGKTTTVCLIYEILKAAGFKVGMVSTVGVKIDDRSIEAGLHVTTPDEDVMQKLFRQMVDAGCTHVVIEVTSHKLAQYKTEGYNVKVAVLTNITHEHLDYHGTMDEYRAAKMRLFKGVQFPIIKYSKTKIKDINPSLDGEYNKYNIGAAEAVAKILKIQETITKQVIKDFAGVPGRREEIKMGQKFRCIVDFAHTPNGLKSLLESLRQAQGRLILVFGCTGERDREKRPVMGKIARSLADIVIVTSDDVRGESLDDIYRDIMKDTTSELRSSPPNLGGDREVVYREDDRDKAIEMAVKMAEDGDIVAAAGMGHETTQLIGKIELKRSDKIAFQNAIKNKNSGAGH